LAALLAAVPLTGTAQDRDRDRDRDKRYEDSEFHARMNGAKKEDKAYRKYLKEHHKAYREFQKVNAKEQVEYWKWRHKHRRRRPAPIALSAFSGPSTGRPCAPALFV